MKYLYFILKNLTRKKVRTTLTVLSIMIAFLLFGLLRTLGAAFEGGARIEGEDRLISINKVTLIQPLPYSYLSKVKALDGVDKVTMANWFGGYYQDTRNRFPQFPVDAEEYFTIYQDTYNLPPEQYQAWKANKTGAVIGKALADQFHWKVGDRVPLIGMFPKKDGSTNWDFVIDGIFTGKTETAQTNMMFFHYDYFDKSRQFGEGTIGWMIIKVKNPKDSAKVSAAVDALFENSSSETKTDSEKEFAKSFAKQFADIGLITTLILSAVFFTMLLVAGNTMAQSFRERIPEFAILKTLGFSDVSVMLMVLAESVFICGFGGFLGLALAKLLVVSLSAKFAMYLPGLNMSATILLMGTLWIILFGVVTGAAPAIQGLRLNIISALRRN
ncbi:membrane protein [Cellvibrio zantedeschiae]|uniref:Membrane protein n=1 Tax=Cellvibrio zantedeschiae TaxID=1237077 RepID=A0ABQ3AQX3_9GAMM|nr:ABC transporter permease [Cellvibrio zantedeschiae]GGY61127.1 membrane protein [Cellvibrio zantedeschiae]